MNVNRFSFRLSGVSLSATGAASEHAGAFGGPSAAPAPPQTLELTGVVRNFIETGKQGGHPDFEVTPSLGFGLYSGNVSATLGSDGKPVFTGDGWLTKTQWKDSVGRPICYRLYNAAAGDVKGVKGNASDGGIKSAASFNQWYNDVPGVNMSAPLTITLNRQEDGTYVFDDKTDPLYANKGGFFPIDSMLLGNSGGSPDHNFHFTFEIHTMFTYKAGAGQVFRFTGDDDVWVYVDHKLVIDLGGIHAAQDQNVAIDRLGLTDGEDYNLDIFSAERHRTQSNFRMVTNLQLSSLAIPAVTAVFD